MVRSLASDGRDGVFHPGVGLAFEISRRAQQHVLAYVHAVYDLDEDIVEGSGLHLAFLWGLTGLDVADLSAAPIGHSLDRHDDNVVQMVGENLNFGRHPGLDDLMRSFDDDLGRIDLAAGVEPATLRIGQLDVHMHAAQHVVKSVPEPAHLKFLLTGRNAPKFRYKFETLAQKLGLLENLLFLDPVDDIAELIASLDIGVVASLGSEASSRITLEYLASGVPVAAYPAPGPVDLIQNGVNGWIDEDLSKAARAALEAPRESCRSFAQRYSWQASTEQFLSHLAPLVARSSADLPQRA